MDFDKKLLIDYVLNRHNSDGGFGFAPPFYESEFPSGLPDTYYCLSILNILEEKIPRKTDIIKFLENILTVHSRQNVLYDFFAFEIANIVGLKLKKDNEKAVFWNNELKISAGEKNKAVEFMYAGYSTSESPFRDAYMSAYLLHFYNNKRLELYKPELKQNTDGGFGIGKSDIVSTAYSIAISKLCNIKINKENAIDFINSCKSKNGFSASPSVQPPFISETYFGCWSLKMLGKKIPNSTVKFAEKLQNKDGGFRRSEFGGISSPEYSFFALQIITKFEKYSWCD